MFLFRRKEEPLLQLYGKLPIAKDYLRVGGGSEACRRFRHWLDRGFGGSAGSAPLVLPGPLRFLWTDRDGTTLQGLVRPSSDAGGLRAFPFALWIERRARPLAEERARWGAGEERWWCALERCEQELDAFRDGEELLAALRARVVVPLAEGAGEEPALDLEGWARELSAAAGPGCERALERLQAQGPEVPLRLPLVPGASVPAQVAAWMRVVGESQPRIRRRPPSVFYPAPRSPAHPLGPAARPITVLPPGAEPDACRWLCTDEEPRGERDPGPAGRTRILARAPAGPAHAALQRALASPRAE